MNYEVVKVDFQGNTKDHREEVINDFLEKGWKVLCVSSYAGKKQYGVVVSLKEDKTAPKQTFVTVNFDHNSLPSRQIEPIRKKMGKSNKVVKMTGFSSYDGEQYGIAAVLEECEGDEQSKEED